MEVRLGKIIGPTNETTWVQVHGYDPGEIRRQTAGQLVIAAAVDQVSGATRLGREVMTRVTEVYYGESEVQIDIYQRLKNCSEVMENEFPGLNLALIVIGEDKVYGVCWGMDMWLAKANGKHGWLTAAGGYQGEVRNSGVVYGSAGNGDVVVAGDKRFWQVIGPEMIIDKTSDEDMVAMLHDGKAMGGAGAVIELKVPATETDAESEIISERETETEKESEILSEREKERVEKPMAAGINIADKWREIWKRVRRERMFLSDEQKQSRRKQVLGIGLGWLVMSGLLLGAGYWRQGQIKFANSEINKKIESLVADQKEAIGLVGLDQARARELVERLNREIGEVRQTAADDERVKRLAAELPGLTDQVMGIQRLEAEEVADLALTREGSVAEKMSLADGVVVVLDTKQNRLFKLDLTRKRVDVVGGGEVLGAGKLVAGYPGKAVVLSDRGLVECNLTKLSCSTRVVSDAAWGEVAAVGMYAGNVYLQTASQIWKYSTGENSYGPRSEWLEASETLNGRMAIDGRIWVVGGSGNGGVAARRFSRGVGEQVTISGVSGVARVDGVYTDDKLEELLILDKDNSRVIRVDKEGKYVGQVVSGAFAQANDIVGVEDKIYIASGSKIWVVDY